MGSIQPRVARSELPWVKPQTDSSSQMFWIGKAEQQGSNLSREPMKNLIALIALLVFLIAARAQNSSAPKSDTPRTNAPARREFLALVSPEVHPDRTVTFRLRAPNAK